ncbi:MAG: class I SAM-dependent methyltransferase [Nitrospirae bacterium]|nr:class I SAM-dependent methyltransferase [Nitrospirota bacterium]
MQIKQKEWHDQWSMFSDEELSVFLQYIYPYTLEDLRNKDVLECGSGGGHHTSFMAPYAKKITAVDLNTIEIAKEKNKHFTNITFLEDDIATMNLSCQFDMVLAIGVIHHTDSPEKTVQNLIKHVKSGGLLIMWVYSLEGNSIVKNVLEPIRKTFLGNTNRNMLFFISRMVTALLYIPVYSVYKLPVEFLPYYKYFKDFRGLSFKRNNLNVFDKLNAPQVDFISMERAKGWLNEDEFKDIHISQYKGVSYRVSGRKM